jgi:RIO-like serine/threonine protein kinase
MEVDKAMTDLSGKKLPTVEEVEAIMAEYGTIPVDEFAERFGLERIVVEATIDCLRRLQRIAGRDAIPAISCYRDDRLESIVRCAGAKHGFI